VSWECNVLKIAQMARNVGHIIDAGATRTRWQMPPIEKPISWVDMTNNHWSVLVRNPSIDEMEEASADETYI
jgi:hypothetical protein